MSKNNGQEHKISSEEYFARCSMLDGSAYFQIHKSLISALGILNGSVLQAVIDFCVKSQRENPKGWDEGWFAYEAHPMAHELGISEDELYKSLGDLKRDDYIQLERDDDKNYYIRVNSGLVKSLVFEGH